MADPDRGRPTIGIAIVNWNAGAQLRACVESVASTDWRTVDLSSLLVVDNASSDGSVDGLARGMALPIEIVRNADNRGFAAACNQASQRINADYILFLNPDAILDRASVPALVALLEGKEHSSVGIAGLQLIGDDGTVSRSCARFPTPWTTVSKSLGLDRLFPSLCPGYVMTDWDHAGSREVDHVMGACYLVRTTVFRALGGFDESFFVYFEDLDFSYRARQAGWRSYYLAGARAYHKGGGTSAQIKDARLFYSLQSRLRYSRKHFSPLAAVCVTFCTLWLEPAIRIVACTVGGSPTPLRDTLAAYGRLWRGARGTS